MSPRVSYRFFAACTKVQNPGRGANWTEWQPSSSVELAVADLAGEISVRLSVECDNQSRSLMSAAILVDIIGAELLMRVVVILWCLSKGRLLGWLSKLTKDRGSSCERILSLLLLLLLQLCKVKRVRGGEVTAVGMHGWRRRHGRTRHVSRVTIRSLVRVAAGKLGGGRGGKEQIFHHALILIHVIHIAISLLSVVEIRLINAILSGPVRARGDTGASAPITHDRVTRMASSPLCPGHVR